jgi:carbon storage regulator
LLTLSLEKREMGFITLWSREMLVLTRRKGQTLIIGNNINVTISDIKGNQVRLGINAPKEVSVNREEIQRKINLEKSNSLDCFIEA